MKITEKVGIHNRFDIEIIDSRTGKVKQKAYAENVILNRLWQQLCSYNGLYFTHIFYGSGTGTPSSSDSTLFHHEGAVQAGTATYGGDHLERVYWCKRSAQLSETTAVGVELSEMGIGYGTAATNVCTHAMLRDMNGNIITILKTDTDIINIYATVYVHWGVNSIFTPFLEQVAWSGSFTYQGLRGVILGTVKDTTYWPSYATRMFPGRCAIGKSAIPITNFEAANAVITGGIAIGSNDAGCFSFGFDPTNKKIVMTATRFAVDTGNLAGGIGQFTLCSYGLRPTIVILAKDFYPGTDISNEAVGTGDGSTKNFALDFDNAESGTVMVDGVVQTTGVSIKRIPMGASQLGQYICRIYSNSSDSHWQVVQQPVTNNSTSYSLGAGWYIANDAYGVGFASITNNGAGEVYGSNNLIDWTLLAEASAGTVTLTGSNQHFKYFKNTGFAAATLTWNSNDGKAIVFDEAPANGAVITCSYHTPYIAKDSDHVLDLSFTLQFGEYSE